LNESFAKVVWTFGSASTIPIKSFILVTRIITIFDRFNSFTKRKVTCWSTSEVPSQIIRWGTWRVAIALVGFDSGFVRLKTFSNTKTIEFEEFIVITKIITILDTTNSSLR